MTRRSLIAVTAAALIAGCGGQTSDKNGGKGGDVGVLRLANANDEPGGLEAYAREVKRASGGRLVIQFVNGYRHGAADPEPGIIADIRDGRIDLASVGARAFKGEGVS